MHEVMIIKAQRKSNNGESETNRNNGKGVKTYLYKFEEAVFMMYTSSVGFSQLVLLSWLEILQQQGSGTSDERKKAAQTIYV